MNKGLFSNRGNNRFESGEVVYSLTKPSNDFIALDGSDKKRFERGVNKNLGAKLIKNGYLAWITQANTFSATVISDLAYGNGLWVGCGWGGQIRTSTDGITWVTRTSNISASGNVLSVAYGNNVWVVGGNALTNGASADIRTSTDGITWVTRTSNFQNATATVEAIAFGGGIFVAGGLGGQIRTSTDGITWVTRTSNISPAGTSTYIYSIAYGNGQWLLCGYAQSPVPTTILRVSTDAITWVTQSSNIFGTSLRRVAYGNGRWVIMGDSFRMSTSTDLVTWTTIVSPFSSEFTGNAIVTSLKFDNNIWMFGDNHGRFASSTDGVSWKAVNSDTSYVTISSLAYGNGIWLRGKYNGSMARSDNRYYSRPDVKYGWLKP